MEFFAAVEEDGVSVYAWYGHLPVFSRISRESSAGFNTLSEFSRGYGRWCVDGEPYLNYARNTLREFLENPAFLENNFREANRALDELNEWSGKALQQDYGAMTGEQLMQTVLEHQAKLKTAYYPSMPSTFVEAPHALATKAIEEFLAKNAETLGMPAARAFEVLTHAPAESAGEHESNALGEIARGMDARLAKKIAAGSKEAWKTIRNEDEALAGALERHASEFAWAYFNYDGPAWGAERFAEELAVMVRDGLARRKREDLTQQRAELERKLAMTGREARLFQFARNTVMLKAKRKDAMFKSFYAVERPLAEIAKRTGLTLAQVRFLLPEELPQAFTYGSKLAQKLDGRAEYCLILQTPQGLKLMEGLEAREFSKRIKTHEATGNETELHGQCACTGEATGAVRIVNLPGDLTKMRAGDVLVSVATTPNIVTAMRKASAIVSDLGGMTSHAAIVSRELGVPCVVGCRIATKTLKDGDTVHVDATNGMVKILERAQAPDGN